MKRVAVPVGTPIIVTLTRDSGDPASLLARLQCNDEYVGAVDERRFAPTTHALYVAAQQTELLQDLWCLLDYNPESISSVTMHLAMYVAVRSLLQQLGLITRATVINDTDWEPYTWREFKNTGHSRVALFCRYVGKAYGKKAETAQRIALKPKPVKRKKPRDDQ